MRRDSSLGVPMRDDGLDLTRRDLIQIVGLIPLALLACLAMWVGLVAFLSIPV